MPVENIRDNKLPEFIMHDAMEIAAGVRHYVVLKKDGTVWTWGSNQYGQLGDGTTTNRDEPKQVIFPK